MGHKQTSRHCSGWVRFTPQSGHESACLGESALCQRRTSFSEKTCLRLGPRLIALTGTNGRRLSRIDHRTIPDVAQ